MRERELEPTTSFLTQVLGFELLGTENGWQRYGVAGGLSGAYVDVQAAPDNAPRRLGRRQHPSSGLARRRRGAPAGGARAIETRRPPADAGDRPFLVPVGVLHRAGRRAVRAGDRRPRLRRRRGSRAPRRVAGPAALAGRHRAQITAALPPLQLPAPAAKPDLEPRRSSESERGAASRDVRRGGVAARRSSARPRAGAPQAAAGARGARARVRDKPRSACHAHGKTGSTRTAGNSSVSCLRPDCLPEGGLKPRSGAERSATLREWSRWRRRRRRTRRTEALLGSRASDAAAVREHHSHGESYHPPAASRHRLLPRDDRRSLGDRAHQPALSAPARFRSAPAPRSRDTCTPCAAASASTSAR